MEPAVRQVPRVRARLRLALVLLREERLQRQTLQLRLAESERHLREVEALAHIGSWEFDLTNDRIQWSQETFRIFGLDGSAHEPDFADLLLSIHPDDAPVFDQAIQRAVMAGESYRLDLRIRCPDGSQKHIHAQGSPIRGNNQEVARIIGTVLDITERKSAEQKLFEDATRDSLTGLANRRTLHAVIEGAGALANRGRNPLSLCLCDLDKFKFINDNYGHATGDETLIAFGGMLREGTRASDTAGRLGGDEFCIVLPNTTVGQASIFVERIRERLQHKAFAGPSGEYRVTATFGIAELGEGMQARDLLEAADGALYRAKEQGRNRVGRA